MFVSFCAYSLKMNTSITLTLKQTRVKYVNEADYYMKKSKSTRASRQLKCTQGNYQCGGRCMSKSLTCRTETHKPEVNKALNSAVVQVEARKSLTKAPDVEYELTQKARDLGISPEFKITSMGRVKFSSEHPTLAEYSDTHKYENYEKIEQTQKNLVIETYRLHRNNIVHGDLSEKNIRVDNLNNITIEDYYKSYETTDAKAKYEELKKLPALLENYIGPSYITDNLKKFVKENEKSTDDYQKLSEGFYKTAMRPFENVEPNTETWTEVRDELGRYEQKRMTEDEIKEFSPEVHRIGKLLGKPGDWRKVRPIGDDSPYVSTASGFFDRRNSDNVSLNVHTSDDGSSWSDPTETKLTMLHEYIHYLQYMLGHKNGTPPTKLKNEILSDDFLSKDQSRSFREVKDLVNSNPHYLRYAEEDRTHEYEAFFLENRPDYIEKLAKNLKDRISRSEK